MNILETIEKYEVLPCYGSTNPFILNLKIAKTDSLFEYLDQKTNLESDPNNIFGSKQTSLGLYLAQGLINAKLCTNLSVYQTNLVIYLGVVDNPEVLHIINQFVANSVLTLSNLYRVPKVLVNLYNPPGNEVILYQRYWQMCWFAHLKRCLGELYKPHISRYNRAYTVKELQQEFEADPEFSWDLLSTNLKYGYQFYNSRIETRNFCAGTSGDLY